MSLPPQPGAWQPPPPPGAHGQQPQGPPPGYQQPWYPPPGPPRPGGTFKWAVLGAAVLAVIAVAAVVIVVVLHSDSGGNSKGSTTSTAGSASGIASANDTGPVTVITDDPTCAPWTPIITALAASEQNGWDKRDPTIAASAWSPEQRAQYQAVGTAMGRGADQMVALARQTPHRVMRELYEQTIAYLRAYADSIPNYAPDNDYLARAASATGEAVQSICNAVTYGSAAARGPLVAAQAPPTQTSPPGDPANPQRFLTVSNPICNEWDADAAEYKSTTAEWNNTDPKIPATQWSPEQKALTDTFGPVMSSFVDKLEQLGRRSGNPTLEDFAVLSAQYGHAYVQGLPSYVMADGYLGDTTAYSSGAVLAACQAVGAR